MSTATTSEPTAISGWRRGVDRVFVYLMTLFFVGVLVQVFLAGVGAFGDHAAKVENASSFDPHRSLGFALGGVAVVLLILALLARVSRATWVGALVLAVLAFVVQSALAGGGDNNKWVGGLHAFDGMVILLLSGWLTGAGHRRIAAERRNAAVATA